MKVKNIWPFLSTLDAAQGSLQIRDLLLFVLVSFSHELIVTFLTL